MLTLMSSTLVSNICRITNKVSSLEHHVVLADETGKTVTLILPANGDSSIGSVFDNTSTFGLNFVTDGHYF